MKNILILLVVVIAVFTGYRLVLSTQTETNVAKSEITITSPQSNQQVGISFLLEGTVPSPWLKEDKFGVTLITNDGEILSQLIEIDAGDKSISTFSVKIDTSGMTTDTRTCFGAANLIVSSLNDPEHSKSVVIDCGQ